MSVVDTAFGGDQIVGGVDELVAGFVNVELEPLFLLLGKRFVKMLVIFLLEFEQFVLFLEELAFLPFAVQLCRQLLEFREVLVVLEPALICELLNQLLLDLFQVVFQLFIDILLFARVQQLVGFQGLQELPGLFLTLDEFLLQKRHLER